MAQYSGKTHKVRAAEQNQRINHSHRGKTSVEFISPLWQQQLSGRRGAGKGRAINTTVEDGDRRCDRVSLDARRQVNALT